MIEAVTADADVLLGKFGVGKVAAAPAGPRRLQVVGPLELLRRIGQRSPGEDQGGNTRDT